MSGQDKKNRIISDLSIIASLTPGKTLSNSTMTVIDHNTWSSSIWRRYAGEDRKNTIGTIKGILTEATSFCNLSPSDEIIVNIEASLTGFSSLKETYKGDYYLI